MMMRVLAVLALTWATMTMAAATADTVSCNFGQAHIPGGFISGSCFNGNCQGWLSGSTTDARGSCTPGTVNFQAQGYSSAQSISGQCRNGFFSGYLSGSTISLSGTCSNGGTFYGSTFAPTQALNGSCSENGSLSVHVFQRSATASGTCTGGR
jgi:hypothetical protein